jgi:precorrin-6B methylase 2
MLIALIIFGFLSLTVFIFLVYLADGVFGGLDFASSRAQAKQVINIIKDRNLGSGRFYDLGSARGGFAVRIAKAFPKLHVRGIDDNGFRTAFAKFRSIFLNNVVFFKGSVFAADISSADIIYIYLPQELMPNLQDKLQKELKPGSIIISNRVSFPNWQPLKKIDRLFIYAKK